MKALRTTMYSFASSSTLHGVNHAFKVNGNPCHRVIWTAILFCCVFLAMYSGMSVFTEWKDKPVMTIVGTTGLPINQLDYPAITVCSQGMSKEVLEKVVDRQFKRFIESFYPNKDISEFSLDELKSVSRDFFDQEYPGLDEPPNHLIEILSSPNPDSTIENTVLFNDDDNEKDCKDALACPSKEWDLSEDGSLCFLWKTWTPFAEGQGYCHNNNGTLVRIDDPEVEKDLYRYLMQNEWLITNNGWLNARKDQNSKQFYYLDKNGQINTTGPPIMNIKIKSEGDNCLRFTAFETSYEKFDILSQPCSNSRQVVCMAKPKITSFPCFNEPKINRRKREIDNSSIISSLDLLLNPARKQEKLDKEKEAREKQRSKMAAIKWNFVHEAFFELLWYSRMPCFDIHDISNTKDGSNLSLLKQCLWKGVAINCSAIFKAQPTDFGMCCSFNIDDTEEMFRASRFANSVHNLQENDYKESVKNPNFPKQFLEEKDSNPEAGLTKGLQLILDANSDKISSKSVFQDFQGFLALVHPKGSFPLIKEKGLLVHPGKINNIEISVTSIKADDNVNDLVPEDRNCIFSHERPLQIFKKYSYSSCFFECKLGYAWSKLGQNCTPWFYPGSGDELTMCSPWDSIEFQKLMDSVPRGICKHCLPNCQETIYKTHQTSTLFKECDKSNIGVSPFCQITLENEATPSRLIQQIKDHYQELNNEVPDFLKNSVLKPNKRHLKLPSLNGYIMFNSSTNLEYDAYEKDIAIVNFYFKDETGFEFIKQRRMTPFEFLFQIGGGLGLFLGCSVISIIEIIYWIIIGLVLGIKN